MADTIKIGQFGSYPNPQSGEAAVTVRVNLEVSEGSLNALEGELKRTSIQYGIKLQQIKDRFSDGIRRGTEGFDLTAQNEAINKLKTSYIEALRAVDSAALNFNKVLPFGEEAESQITSVANAYRVVEKNIQGAAVEQDRMSKQLSIFNRDFENINRISVSGGLISELTTINEKLLRTDVLAGEITESMSDMLKQGIDRTAIVDLQSSMDEMKTSLSREIPAAWDRFFTKGLVVTAGLAAASLFAYAQIESTVTNLQIRLGEAAGSAGELRGQLRGIASEVNTSLADAAGAVTIATRLGLTNEEAEALTLTLADLATVTGDLTGATGATVFAMNTYGEAAGTAEDISHKLFIAWRDAGIGAGELQSVIAQLGPTAMQAGIGFDELIASFIVTGQSGLTTSSTMSGMIMLLTKMQSPTGELASAFSALGVDALPQAIEKFGSLAGVLQALNVYAAENGIGFGKLVGGYRTLRVATALASSEGERFAEIQENLATTTDEVGRAAELAADDISHVFRALRRDVGVAVQEVGSGVALVLAPIAGFITTLADLSQTFDAVAIAMKAVGVVLVALVAAFAAGKVVIWVQAMRAGTAALALTYKALIGLLPITRANTAAQGQLALSFKASEAGAISAAAAMKFFALAIVAVAAFKVWEALEKRMEKIKLLADELSESFKLFDTEGVDKFTESIAGNLRDALKSDDDFVTLITLIDHLGISLNELAEDAVKNGPTYKKLGELVAELLAPLKTGELNTIEAVDYLNYLEDTFGLTVGDLADLKLKIAGEIPAAFTEAFEEAKADVLSIFGDTGETPSIDYLELLGFGPEDEIYVAAAEAAEVITEAVVNVANETRKAIEGLFDGREIKDRDLFKTLLIPLIGDEEDLENIFGNIEASIDSQIDSLMNTIFTKPIEQMEGGAAKFAEVLMHNVETIEVWKQTIAAFESTGNIALAEQLANMGPEATSAFVDIFNQGPAVRDAFEGTLREAFGGFSPEELAGTFGNSIAEILAGDEFLSRTVGEHGTQAITDYVDALIDIPDEQKKAVKDALAGMFVVPGTVLAEEVLPGINELFATLDAYVPGLAGESAEVVGAAYSVGVATGILNNMHFAVDAARTAAINTVNAGNLGFQNKSPSKLGIKTGGDYMRGIWRGILKDLNTDAVRVGKKVGTAVNKAIGEGMREGISDLGNAFKTIFRADDIQREIDGAIENISDLISRYEDELPAEIESIKEALEIAKKIGGQGIITAAEQVSIESAQKSVKDLKLAYEQGFVSAAELKAGEDALVEAREDAIKKTDEVIRLEDDLVGLNEELVETNEAISRSIEDLNDLYIDAALFMFDIVDAMDVIDTSSPAVVDAFKKMAEAAGIPAEAFDTMIRNAKDSMDFWRNSIEMTGIKINFKPGANAKQGGGGGGGGGIVPVIPIPPAFDVITNLKMRLTPDTRRILDFFMRGGAGITLGGINISSGAIGATFKQGQFGFVGERGPEIIRGPATVMGTKETASLLRNGVGGSSVSTGGNVAIYVQPSWPIDYDESRYIAGNIRDAMLELEREES